MIKKLNPKFDDLNSKVILDHISELTANNLDEILESLRINPTDKIEKPKTAWLQNEKIILIN